MEAVVKKENADNLPDRNSLEKIVTELKAADLSNISYQKIFYTLLNEVRSIPFVTTKLKSGYHIERARINKPGQVFKSERELSYRTDFENIKSFGRANYPGQSLFYGAIKTDHVQYPRIVNLFETSEMFRSGDKEKKEEFVMTVGKWRIKNDIEVVESVFNKPNIQNIPQIKKAYDHHMAKITSDLGDKAKDVEYILEFFSDEFAKNNIKSPDDYKISAAYTEMAINFKNFAGVAYPSVRTNYEGFNVALAIPAVETHLQLEVVAMFKIYKRGPESFMDNLAYATELGPLNSEFKWINMEGTPEEFINNIIFK
jgi:hypothetical protein